MSSRSCKISQKSPPHPPPPPPPKKKKKKKKKKTNKCMYLYSAAPIWLFYVKLVECFRVCVLLLKSRHLFCCRFFFVEVPLVSSVYK